MNKIMQKLGVLTLTLSAFLSASAADFEVDGIFYNITDPAVSNTVEVTYGEESYTGNITLPTSVTHNGVQYAVTAIGNRAFFSCSGLTSITIPGSVRAIRESAFAGCSGLTSITIPNSVMTIWKSAFESCRGLTSITIPGSVTTIGERAFATCRGLTSIALPNSVTTIRQSAFENCSGLTSITLSNSVTTIGECAFAGCYGLTSITFPNSVTTIGLGAFYFCSGLTSIISFAVTPPACDFYALSDVNKSVCTLYVPAESREAYRQAAEWSAFTLTEDIVYVSSIQLNETAVSIEEGSTFSLTAEVQPTDATIKNLQWETSNANCVTVDENGLLTAHANGTATITVRSFDGKAEATCTVTVVPTTGIEAVSTDGTSEVEVFTLTGVKVADSTAGLPAGIYLVRQGSTMRKVAVK